MGGGVKMGKSQLSGITVEIGGDTSGLDKALKSVNVQANSLKKEMKDVQSSLKVNPENVTLLAQQSQIAAKQIQIASDKLNILKSVEKQVEEQFQNGDIGEQEYRAFQREVINAESTLKDLQKQQENLQNTNNSTTDSVENLAETEEDVVKNTDEASDNIEDLAETEEKAEDKTSSFKDTMTKLGAGLADFAKSAASLAISAVKELSELMKSSIDVGKEFESSMSQVAATMGITANSADFETLEKAAKEMGATTAFSASEAAEALNYLALAGYNAEKAATALPTVLNLAGAGGMDLASASDLITDAMAALQIEIDEDGVALTEFADKMAKTAQKSNTSVSQLGEAILTVGGTASKMKGGTTELNAALGVLANVGIKGAEGGTHLRNMLLSLQSPTDDATELIKELGVTVYDAKGNLRGIDEIFRDLQKGMQGMSNAEVDNILSTVFNKTDLAAAQAMLKGCGAEFQNLVKEIDSSAGACEDMYKTMLDNLNGDIDIFKSSMSALGIEIYESMSESLRDIIQKASKVVDVLNQTFQKKGFEGLVESVGGIFSDIIARIAEYAPSMIDASVSFIEAFGKGITQNSDKILTTAQKIVSSIVDGIVRLSENADSVANGIVSLVKAFVTAIKNNASKLFEASKNIVKAIVDGLIQLLPVEVQTPIKKCIKAIANEFNSSSLKSAINEAKKFIIKLTNAISNIAIKVLPILVKILNLVCDNFDKMLTLVIAAVAAYKTYKTTVTLVTSAIKLANTASALFNGTLATNPIGLVAVAAAGLAGVFMALKFASNDLADGTDELWESQERLEKATEECEEAEKGLGERLADLGGHFGEFQEQVNDSVNILDSFNEELIVPSAEKERIANAIDDVQEEITEIAKKALENRRNLTNGEIERIDNLLERYKELSGQEFEFSVARQNAVLTQTEVLVKNSDKFSEEEYKSEIATYLNSAEQAKNDAIEKAKGDYLAQIQLNESLRAERGDEWAEKANEEALNERIKREDEANAVYDKNSTILTGSYVEQSENIRNIADELANIAKEYDNIERSFSENRVALNNWKHQQEEYIKRNSGIYYEEDFNDLNAEYDTKANNLESARKEDILSLYNKALEILDDDALKALDTFNTMLEDCGDTVDLQTLEIVKKIKSYFDTIPLGVKEAMGNTYDILFENFNRIQSDISTEAKSTVDKFYNQFKTMPEYLKKALGSSYDIFIEEMEELKNGNKTADEIVQGLNNIFEKLPGYIKGNFNEVYSELNNLMANMETSIETKKSNLFEKAASMGLDIINGIKKGLNSGNLHSMLRGLISGTIDTMKKMFGINSPSKVMSEMFGYVVQGAILGIKNNQNDLYSTAKTFAGGFLDNIDDNLKKAVFDESLLNSLKSAAYSESANISTLLANKSYNSYQSTSDSSTINASGNITTHITIDGREFAVATAKYMNEELAFIR